MILLIVSFLVGYGIIKQLWKIENNVMVLAGSFLVGSLISGTVLYLLDLLFISTINNYILSNIIFFILAITYIIFYCYKLNIRTHIKIIIKELYKDKYVLIIGIFFLIYSIWVNYYTFGINNGDIEIRGGAWSDIMYHHAFIRSISLGTNIPTTYPYFANTDIHYHFMFNYYGGKLSQFGLNTIHSLNILSSLSFTFLLLLLFEFGRIYFKNKLVGIITPILLVLHSSAAAFKWIRENSIVKIFKQQGWLKDVNYEGWGLFNFNVFVNQRHFAFALAICVFFVLYIILYREYSIQHKDSMFDKQVILKSLFLGILIGITPFWNLIAAPICIIFVGLFAILEFKKNSTFMLGLLSSAFVAGLLVIPQLLLIKSGDTVLSQYPIFRPGYEIQNLGVVSFITYYYKVLGIKLILIIISFIFIDSRKKLEFLIFSIPFIIANVWQMGKIQYDNNKLMMIWLLFANCYAAHIIVSVYKFPNYLKELQNDLIQKYNRRSQSKNQKLALLKKSKKLGFIIKCRGVFKSIAVILFISIIFAGIIDFFALKNISQITIKDNTSELKQWIIQNTEPKSIFLTSNFIPYGDNAISGVTLSGRMLYCVRNDVDSSVNIDTRMDNINSIYTFKYGLEKTIELIKKEKINYILVDSTLRNTEAFKVNEDIFMKNFKLEYHSKNEYDDQDVRIFSVK